MFNFPDKMKRVFADEKLQQQFESEGYVVVDFYDPAQITELEKLYHDLHPVDEKGFFPSTFSKDKNYRLTADEEIRRIGGRWINQNLVDFKVMCGSFIVKYPGAESIMQVHQDMTLVDETAFTGINIWCPLIDLNDTNGVLHVIPKSNRIIPTYRGSTVPGLYDDVQTEILPYGQPVFLKAGKAIIFDQSIIHFSPPNVSDNIRITTNIYFTHKDAKFQIAYWNKDFGSKVELFEQDETFMTNFEQFGENIFDKPKIGKSLGLIDYNFPKLTPQWLEDLYGKPKLPVNGKEIFQDPALQEKFDKQGFVHVPFLTQTDIDDLLKIFWELHPDIKAQGFQSSSYSNDFKYKKECSDRITDIYKKHFERIFKNYRPFGSAFLFKQPDEYSELPIHQDWTIVDEEKFVALNIWVPLCDTDENNGTLFVLPGSQYGIVKAIRCPTLPMFFEGSEQLMIQNSIPMKAKAGEAIILNQSIVHYSPPNKSDKIRIAITSGVMSAEPKMNFHYRTPEMKDDFLISFENFFANIYNRPAMGKSIGTKKYIAPIYKEDELKQLLQQMKDKSGIAPAIKASAPAPPPVQPVIQQTEKQKSLFRRILDVVGI
ncbi:MAG: hypothetical protein JWO06_1691 [Bacteroidota bacterium]|nr:hypothetical protein [Bacteroidota bacterium]